MMTVMVLIVVVVMNILSSTVEFMLLSKIEDTEGYHSFELLSPSIFLFFIKYNTWRPVYRTTPN